VTLDRDGRAVRVVALLPLKFYKAAIPFFLASRSFWLREPSAT